jgi:hypothetical protein
MNEREDHVLAGGVSEVSGPDSDGISLGALFVSSAPMTLLEHFRIPYEIDPDLARDRIGEIRPVAGGPSLFWPVAASGRVLAATTLGADGATAVPLFAEVLPDHELAPLLAERGDGWRRVQAVTDRDGRPLGSIWRRQDGSVLIPFDPDQVISNYWSERYAAIAIGARTYGVRRALIAAYYRARPLLPRSLQIWLRRQFAYVQARSKFPRWPIETCLHDFFELMLSMLTAIAGEPLPYISAWPAGHTWALVLTHDVEQAKGLAALDPVLAIERARGMRSSWNLVPRRYSIDDELVMELVADGFEVGVHGLYHDGRDLESKATIERRRPAIREIAERWGAVGFRSPAMHRQWDWMPLLGFEYDTSSQDTDPFEPQAGGCCTWLPFFNRGMVELPATLVQDHTLFVILRRTDETAWIQKADFLRERGGMALIDTHPDYLIDERILAAYTRFLDRYVNDASAWKALPREVSSWWRRRAASRPERDQGGWHVIGPAADEARVEFCTEAWCPQRS